jgi:D-serine deaminase-like pyridoxal phosphate-dependent protein
MDPRYKIEDTSEIITPALVLFRELMEQNLDGMIKIAGDPSRLRPHCKTCKMSEVVRTFLERGITKVKAATFAEAEMVAKAGGQDVCLAYLLVGPNIPRAVRFVEKFSEVVFSVCADHGGPIDELSRAMSAANQSVQVLLDIDTGLHRTGLEVGPAARALYEQIARSDGLLPGGFHVYDGQNHQTSLDERCAAVHQEWDRVIAFRDELVAAGFPVPRILAGGTGTFPVYAAIDDPTIELSPGTCVLNDHGYSETFPDLEFSPATVILTRVISRPTSDRITVDVGTKAVASDPPMGSRMVFPDLPDAKQVLHNEEHLVLQSPEAERFQPGDELMAIPTHICPTTALHKEVYIVEDGRVSQRWAVVARDRWLTI